MGGDGASAGPGTADRLIGLLRMGRPLFLVGGFAFHGLGLVAAAWAGQAIDWAVALWAQVAITCVQLLTHYANEYYDLPADQANPTPTRWAGGSRVLPAGVLPARAALVAAVVCAGLAAGATCVLTFALDTGPATWPLVGAAMLLGWGYTGPPLRLEWRGLGELTIVLLTPGLTPVAGFYLQTGRVDPVLLLALVPICLLELAMSLAINVPDAEGDARVGKRTLVVLLGPRGAAGLYLAAVVGAYASLPLIWLAGLPGLNTWLAALSAPLGAWLAWRVARGGFERPADWDGLNFLSTALVMGTAGLVGLGFLVPVIELALKAGPGLG